MAWEVRMQVTRHDAIHQSEWMLLATSLLTLAAAIAGVALTSPL